MQHRFGLVFKFNPKYSMPEQVYSRWFRLNEATGEILTSDIENIDYEKFNQALLSIDVYDSNKIFIENVIVKVSINDLNDNVPHFDMSYQYEVSINEDDLATVNQDRFIAKFKAYDLDGTALNSLIEYSIEHIVMPKESVFFNISAFKLIKTEEQGVVSLYKQKGYELDRDNKLIGNKIVLLVKVEDQCSDIYQRLSSTKQITIHLIDLNDNPPMIVNDEQMSAIKIREDWALIEPFTQIKTADADEGLNAELLFEIQEELSVMVPNKVNINFELIVVH